MTNFGLDFFTYFWLFLFCFVTGWEIVIALRVNANGRAVAFGVFAAFSAIFSGASLHGNAFFTLEHKYVLTFFLFAHFHNI